MLKNSDMYLIISKKNTNTVPKKNNIIRIEIYEFLYLKLKNDLFLKSNPICVNLH